MAEEDGTPSGLWFGRTPGRLGFGPLSWQGRALVFLYVFLVVTAIFLYSQLGLTVLVIGFYTVAFILLVLVKSDLRDHWPPGP